jgi:UDP-N-acetyl-2-amino-2-deoxyglucuronate dehydrogenase
MSSLRFALVGCGRIAKRHSDLLGCNQVEGARLAAVCDVVQSRAEAIGRRFGVPAYLDMHEMMAREDVDVVVVLTESGRHAEHVVALARHGKHIVVEKPMALTPADADRMIAACDAACIRLFVVKQNRLNVPVVKLREALEAGRFGKLVMGTVRVRWHRDQAYYDQDAWRGTLGLDGGVLANQASHHIDLLEWVMGDVDSVFAMGRTALVDIEAEDTAVVVLRFANGALGVIEATNATRPRDLEGSISVLGEGGTVVIGGFAANEMLTWSFTKRKAGDDDVLSKCSGKPPNAYGFGHQAYYEQVVQSIRSGTSQPVDGASGRKSVELISAIRESIETGKEVSLRQRASRCRLGRGHS